MVDIRNNYFFLPRCVIAVLSGVLTGLALLLPASWMWTILGIALLLWLLRSARSAKDVFCISGLSYFVHMLVVLSWLWGVHDASWLGVSATAQLGLTAFFWFTCAGVVALGFACTVCAGYWVVNDQQKSLSVVLPLCVLLGEQVGRQLLAYYTLGPAGWPTPSVGFGLYGLAGSTHNALYALSSIGGVYIVGAALVLLATLVVCAARWWRLALLLVVFTTSVLPFGSQYSVPTSVADVALAVTNLPSRIETTAHSAAAASTYGDIVKTLENATYTSVVLPEDARIREFVTSQELAAVGIPLYTSAHTSGDKTDTLVQEVIEMGNVTYGEAKKYYVPLGEYMPAVFALLLRGAGFGSAVERFTEYLRYAPASMQAAYPRAPMVFCYESIVPWVVKTRVTDETVFVPHAVSHAWLTKTPSLLDVQLTASLQVQARWAGVMIVQAGNRAPARVYYPDGRVFERRLPTDQAWALFTVADLSQPKYRIR